MKALVSILSLFAVKCVQCPSMAREDIIDMLTPYKAEGEACGYESCPQIRAGEVNVHIVPSTHFESGHIKTFNEYFHGSRPFFAPTIISAKRTYDNVITQLWSDSLKKFTVVDMAYFIYWWKKRDPTVRRMVYELIRQGRLNFVGGGLVIPDEATTSYHALIETFTYSLRMINSTFMGCGRPLVTWQVHSLGHSREMASLLAQMGFDGHFIYPISYDDFVQRMNRQGLEFLWRGSDDLGVDSDIYTHVLFDGFRAPPGFCFSSRCKDELVINSNDYFKNTEKRVKEFIDSMKHRQSPNYNTSNVLVVMGDAEAYYDAPTWFASIDKLIWAESQQRTKNSKQRFNLFYSTPYCYLRAVHEAGPSLETKQDDFYPLATNVDTYTSGLFTTAPSIKLLVREALVCLQIAKQLQVLAKLYNNDDKFEELQWIYSIFQDHSVIAGNMRDYVKKSFVRKLDTAVQKSTLIMAQALNKVRDSPRDTIYYRCQFNMSMCHTKERFVLVYNPLAWPVTMPVRVPSYNVEYKVYTHDDKEVPTSLMRIPDMFYRMPGRDVSNGHELIFIADKIPALGFRSYYIVPQDKKTERIKRDTGDEKTDKDSPDDGEAEKLKEDKKKSQDVYREENLKEIQQGERDSGGDISKESRPKVHDEREKNTKEIIEEKRQKRSVEIDIDTSNENQILKRCNCEVEELKDKCPKWIQKRSVQEIIVNNSIKRNINATKSLKKCNCIVESEDKTQKKTRKIVEEKIFDKSSGNNRKRIKKIKTEKGNVTTNITRVLNRDSKNSKNLRNKDKTKLKKKTIDFNSDVKRKNTKSVYAKHNTADYYDHLITNQAVQHTIDEKDQKMMHSKKEHEVIDNSEESPQIRDKRSKINIKPPRSSNPKFEKKVYSKYDDSKKSEPILKKIKNNKTKKYLVRHTENQKIDDQPLITNMEHLQYEGFDDDDSDDNSEETGSKNMSKINKDNSTIDQLVNKPTNEVNSTNKPINKAKEHENETSPDTDVAGQDFEETTDTNKVGPKIIAQTTDNRNATNKPNAITIGVKNITSTDAEVEENDSEETTDTKNVDPKIVAKTTDDRNATNKPNAITIEVKNITSTDTEVAENNSEETPDTENVDPKIIAQTTDDINATNKPNAITTGVKNITSTDAEVEENDSEETTDTKNIDPKIVAQTTDDRNATNKPNAITIEVKNMTSTDTEVAENNSEETPDTENIDPKIIAQTTDDINATNKPNAITTGFKNITSTDIEVEENDYEESPDTKNVAPKIEAQTPDDRNAINKPNAITIGVENKTSTDTEEEENSSEETPDTNNVAPKIVAQTPDDRNINKPNAITIGVKNITSNYTEVEENDSEETLNTKNVDPINIMKIPDDENTTDKPNDTTTGVYNKTPTDKETAEKDSEETTDTAKLTVETTETNVSNLTDTNDGNDDDESSENNTLHSVINLDKSTQDATGIDHDEVANMPRKSAVKDTDTNISNELEEKTLLNLEVFNHTTNSIDLTTKSTKKVPASDSSRGFENITKYQKITIKPDDGTNRRFDDSENEVSYQKSTANDHKEEPDQKSTANDLNEEPDQNVKVNDENAESIKLAKVSNDKDSKFDMPTISTNDTVNKNGNESKPSTNHVPITTNKPVNTTLKESKPSTYHVPTITIKETGKESKPTRRNFYEKSDDNFIENQYVKLTMDSKYRKLNNMQLSNGVNISLDIQFYYYIADFPEKLRIFPYDIRVEDIAPDIPNEYPPKPVTVTAPGINVMRSIDSKPVPILDYLDVKVLKSDLVQEIQYQYADHVSLTVRLYKDSPVVETDWIVAPVPYGKDLPEGFGTDIIIRYMTDLETNGAFYTDSNGRQTIKRVRDMRPMYEHANHDRLAGNYYPVTSKIYVEDEDRNIRFSIFPDRAQGGTSLNDGEIELMVHRRILTEEDQKSAIFANDTEFDQPVWVRGKHKLYLSKADYKPNKIFEKKLAKELDLAPIVLSSIPKPYGKNSKKEWTDHVNEMSFVKNKLPLGVHLLTLQEWNDHTLLIRLENYLEKSDVIKSGIKTVFLRHFLSNIQILDAKETTLGANIWLKDFAPLLWKKKDRFVKSFNEFYVSGKEVEWAEDDYSSVVEAVDLDKGIVLKPQQIRTFVCTYEYSADFNYDKK